MNTERDGQTKQIKIFHKNLDGVCRQENHLVRTIIFAGTKEFLIFTGNKITTVSHDGNVIVRRGGLPTSVAKLLYCGNDTHTIIILFNHQNLLKYFFYLY